MPRTPSGNAFTTDISQATDRTYEAVVIEAPRGSLDDAAIDWRAIASRLEEMSRRAIHVVVLCEVSAGELKRRLKLKSPGPGTIRLLDHDDDADDVGGVYADLAAEGIGSGLVLSAGPIGSPHLPVLVDEQLSRRDLHRVPSIDEDPGWTLPLSDSPRRRRVDESLAALSDWNLGIRGAREEDGPGSEPLFVAGGVYTDGDTEHLLPGPVWTGLVVPASGDHRDRSVLDMRTGVLFRERTWKGRPPLRTLRFISASRPGAMAMRAEGPSGAMAGGASLLLPGNDVEGERELSDGVEWARTYSRFGSISLATREEQHLAEGRRTIERLVACMAGDAREASRSEAVDRRRRLENVGFDLLLAEHRREWARRWDDAWVAIHGDPEAELATRFAIFHLLTSAAPVEESAVGARGLSGQAYGGHVFWDADVFVLPFLAATRPAAALSLLNYRVARLPAARASAASLGLVGARFPWESGHDGNDVTPHFVRSAEGGIVPILTGMHEEHICADIAWAAWQYAQWSGDDQFIRGAGRPLLTETARYWASRVREGNGRFHLYGVVGPDEYHEVVDDNAFTNLMVAWNLRTAAALVKADGIGGTPDEVARWLRVADLLVDGYDPTTGCYEQFAGYRRLEPLLIGEFGKPPIAADVLLGRDRVQHSQIIKQADVLMAHHLIPDAVEAGSLEPNLAFYAPRTAHGSSLSPAIHASLLARAGRCDEALEMYRLASRMDLDDLTNTTAAGLHLATMGGLWQALVFGFVGARVGDGVLRVDPRLPDAWERVEVGLRVRQARVRLFVEHDAVEVRTDSVVDISVRPGEVTPVEPPGQHFSLGAREGSEE